MKILKEKQLLRYPFKQESAEDLIQILNNKGYNHYEGDGVLRISFNKGNSTFSLLYTKSFRNDGVFLNWTGLEIEIGDLIISTTEPDEFENYEINGNTFRLFLDDMIFETRL